VSDLRLKLKEQSSKNSELQNMNHMMELQKGDAERLLQIEMEYQRSQQNNRDLQSEVKTVNAKYHELEHRLKIESEKLYSMESECNRYQAYCKDL
jgi:predicted nuclease with TOPRIM domain